ncbi:MAG: hypothetical protein ACYTEQ_29865 [Planctomycetota bacterium]|jgi:hypothetical protein
MIYVYAFLLFAFSFLLGMFVMCCLFMAHKADSSMERIKRRHENMQGLFRPVHDALDEQDTEIERLKVNAARTT